MTSDPVTFGLAWIGYSLLAVDFALRSRGRRHRRLTALTAIVVVAHVACIYVFRFDGSIAEAWRKSVSGFLLFHSALGLIIAAPLIAEPWRTRCVLGAFAVVSLGALGVPFRYPELAVLAGPLFATFGAAVVAAAGVGTKSRKDYTAS